MSKVLPDAVEEEIVRLYRSGLSRRQVGARVHVHAGTVSRVLGRRNLPMRPQGGPNRTDHRLPHSEFQRTVRLYEAGMSTSQVARAVGRTPNAVRCRLKEAGVQFRERGEGNRLRRRTEPFGSQLRTNGGATSRAG